MMKNLNDILSGSVFFKRGTFAVGIENKFTISTSVNKLFLGVSQVFGQKTVVKARVGLETRAQPPVNAQPLPMLSWTGGSWEESLCCADGRGVLQESWWRLI